MSKSAHKMSFETKLVVKPSFSGEFVQLSVSVKHSGMYSVPDPVGRGESSNRRQETERSLSRVKLT